MRTLSPSGAFVASLVAASLLPSVRLARAADVNADPSTYEATLTVTGPSTEPPTTVFQASPDGCCDVVEITNSSYLAIENLYVDAMHVDSAFGISAK